MSILQLFACESCGATAEPRHSKVGHIMGFASPPDDWLVLEGPATADEAKAVSNCNKAPKRHACPPVCLVDVAMRLAELPGAIEPAGAVAP